MEKDIFGGDLVKTLPVGFRFVPKDLELVRDYLLKKITNQPLPSYAVVIEYDVYNTEPWNLPVKNIDNCARFYKRKIRNRNYYFVRREKNDDKKSLCDGARVKHMVKRRAGTSNRIVGYWERTRLAQQDKLIRDERKKIVGIMKAFVFYHTTNNGNNDNECSDIKTGWFMREYTLNSQQFQPLVLCSVINKSQFNISFEYDDNNNYIKRIDCPPAPIDPDEAERNAAIFTRACLALCENSKVYLAQGPENNAEHNAAADFSCNATEEEKFCPKEKKKEIEKDIFGGDLVNMAVTVPSGFRFVPTDLELVRDYLLKKITNQPLPSYAVVIEYDVYNKEPWNLPVNNTGNCARFYRRSIRKRNYYFVPREKNDDTSLCDGNRVKHMVKCGDGTSNRIVGYWKRTRMAPQAKLVRDERKKIVGIMKTFVFHYYTTNNGNDDKNDNECSIETKWIMHEFTLNSQRFQPWVVCSVINKSVFNISFRYSFKYEYKVIDDPPIDPDVAEGNAAFATRVFLHGVD